MIELPQRPHGTASEQVNQLFTYIFQTVEKLNLQLQQIEDKKTATNADLTSLHTQIQGIQEKIGQFMADNEQGA